jgi:cytochrome c peroxidase
MAHVSDHRSGVSFVAAPRRFVAGLLGIAAGVAMGALAVFPQAVAAQGMVPRITPSSTGYRAYAVDQLPAHFKFGEVAALDNTPANNLLSDAGAALGRVLFYDTRLSHDGSTSCASCHVQSAGFSDPNQFSTGINGQLTGRHSMALANGVYYVSGAAFWDERAESLEEQALMPIVNPGEMGSTLPEVVAKLQGTAFYPALFQAAFGTAEITAERIGKAIAQFERAMVSYQSKYDTAFAPGSTTPDFAAKFTPDELAGQAIFHGVGRCEGCHQTHAHVGEIATNVGLDNPVIDEGAGEGRFKTPSLRNVGVRGRFMHDGRFSSLREVVEFYNAGVQDTPNTDETLRNPLQLGLTPAQVDQLVAYLETLTDEEFLTSELFSDPFVALRGDYNADGLVDAADYNAWLANYDSTESGAADGNGDGVTDLTDYVVWRDNLGASWLNAPGGSGPGLATEAPEPGAAALVGIAIAAVAPRRRRR